MKGILLAPLLAGLGFASLAPAQTQTAILTPSDGSPGDRFGWDVELEGDVALVGAPRAKVAQPLGIEGAVYAFERRARGWTQVQKLVASNYKLGHSFGVSVAMDGVWAAIAAPGAGAVYLFEYTAAGWVKRQQLACKSCCEVVMEGGRVMAGDPYAGTITVFELSGGTWSQVTSFDGYAYSLDLDGDRVVGGSGQYAAVYHLVGTDWVQEQHLGGSCCHTAYGAAVQLGGTSMLVADPYNAGYPFIRVFEYDGVYWQFVEDFYRPEMASLGLGASLARDGDLLAIGDPFSGYLPSGSVYTGAVYLYRPDGSSFSVTGKLTASDGQGGDWFGWACDVSGERVLVGAPAVYEEDAGGKAYVFEVADFAQSFCLCDPGSACGNPYPLGGCENSRELGAILGASGSPSVAADDLVLSVTQLPVSQFGLIFMGDAQVPPVPMADGLRCVGGALFRFPAHPTGGGGIFNEGPGIVAHSATFGAAGQIFAGQTWHFQFWARDPQGPCGQGSNLSNALSVTFTP